MSNREKFLKKFKENTGKEFTPDLVYEYSNYLPRHFHKYFDEWWNPEKYNWDYSHYLAIYCPDHFDKWWDSERFNWRGSDDLAIHCPEHFDKWWDPDKFNWRSYSDIIAVHYSDRFGEWWDPDKFNWGYVGYLYGYCYNHFQWKLDGVRLGKIELTGFDPKDIAKIKKHLANLP